MESMEIKEFRSRIGRAIKKLRNEEEISAAFLAKMLNVTQPTISRIESGISSIPAEKLCFIAKCFNRPLAYFIGAQNPVVFNEEDILRAGMVFYGAHHLKSKRTVDVLEYYRTYADFLNAALKFSNDTRFIAALSSTLFHQSAKNELNLVQILSTITHEKLQIRLYKISEITSNAVLLVRNKSVAEKNRICKRLRNLRDELHRQIKSEALVEEEFGKVNINPQEVATFIDESIGHG